MQRLALAETGYIEITRLAGIVWTVDGQAPVEADDQEAHVVAKTDTCAYSQLIDKLLYVEFFVLSEDIIDPLHMGDLIGFQLRVAACNDNLRIGILTTQTMNGLPVLVVGSIVNRACVDDNNVRFFVAFSPLIASFNMVSK